MTLNLVLIAFFGLLVGATNVHAQTQTHEQSAAYVSPVDESLTIRKVGLLPVTDNVEGIYSRHIETLLSSLMRASHRWDFVDVPPDAKFPPITGLEESPNDVIKLTEKMPADAFVTAVASRGPSGLSVRLDMFLKSDGRLIAQETLRDDTRFELANLKMQIRKLYAKLVADVPYDGLILSRQQNHVTVNLGRSDGIQQDQFVTAIQIISVKRHPKFGFLIGSEKEILGRIKITQVDETLSFGTIVSEKERGAIQKFAKISGIDPVRYPDEATVDENGNALSGRPDSGVVFGDHPSEWLPTRTPSFGQVGVNLGFGSFTNSTSIAGSQTYDASDSPFPQISAHVELWLNSEWTIRADLMQAVITTNDPRAGGKLNQSVSRYSLEGQYNFLLKGDYFGPKFFAQAGFMDDHNSVDDSSPRAFTNTSYEGLLLGLGGSFPITPDKRWTLGGQFNLFLFPRLSQSPDLSDGIPSSTMDEFSINVQRKLAENLWFVGTLEYDLYLTTFSGASSGANNASSMSQRFTVLSGGINWDF